MRAIIGMGASARSRRSHLIEAVERVNESQKQVLFHKIRKHFAASLSGKTLAVWGLAFKPRTDDIREPRP